MAETYRISCALLHSLIFYVVIFMTRCRRLTGKCKDEGSSGGGDDAAELGIGNVCSHTNLWSNVINTNPSLGVLLTRQQRTLVASFLYSALDVSLHLLLR